MEGNSCDNWSMGEPPKLSRDNFRFWKNRMIAFLNCLDSNLLTTIREGPAIPEMYQDNEVKHWIEDYRKNVALEHKAKHIIVMSIPDDIYHLVINCETAKEIWDSLVLYFEGNDEVRRNKGYLLVRQFQMFTSKPGESITEMYSRFTCLLNDLKEYNRVLDDGYVVHKFLESLPLEWDPISTAIRFSENFETMSIHTLYGKLLSHEIQKAMDNVSVIEEENKVVKDEERW